MRVKYILVDLGEIGRFSKIPDILLEVIGIIPRLVRLKTAVLLRTTRVRRVFLSYKLTYWNPTGEFEYLRLLDVERY